MRTTPMPFDPPVPVPARDHGPASRFVAWLVDDAPSREEARRRIRSKPGLIASLSPEALEYVRNYDGPENMGGPGHKR